MKENFPLDKVQQYPNVMELLANCPLRIINELSYVEYHQAETFQLIQGNYYNFVYIILEGEFEITLTEKHSSRSMVLALYDQEGALIGEQEAILDRPYSSSVINTTPCKLLRITKECFCQWIALDQQFSYYLLKNQCQQVYDLSNQAGHYFLHSAKEQIALFLHKQYLKGKTISKQEVNRAVTTSNRHVNRILADLDKREIIALNQSSIHILKPQELLYYGEE